MSFSEFIVSVQNEIAFKTQAYDAEATSQQREIIQASVEIRLLTEAFNEIPEILSRVRYLVPPNTTHSTPITFHQLKQACDENGFTDIFIYTEIQMVSNILFDRMGNVQVKQRHPPGLHPNHTAHLLPGVRTYYYYPCHTLSYHDLNHFRPILNNFTRVAFMTEEARTNFREAFLLYTLRNLKVYDDNGAWDQIEPLLRSRHSVIPHTIEYDWSDVKVSLSSVLHPDKLSLRKTLAPFGMVAGGVGVQNPQSTDLWVTFVKGNYEVTNRKSFELVACVIHLLHDIWTRVFQLGSLFTLRFCIKSTSKDNFKGEVEGIHTIFDWKTIVLDLLPNCPDIFRLANKVANDAVSMHNQAVGLDEFKWDAIPAWKCPPSREIFEKEYKRKDNGDISANICVFEQMDLSSRTMRDIYRCSNALVHVSKIEGFGLPLAEAQVCGCPVIAPMQYNASIHKESMDELVRLTGLKESTFKSSSCTNFWYNPHMGGEMWLYPDIEDIVRRTLLVLLVRTGVWYEYKKLVPAHIPTPREFFSDSVLEEIRKRYSREKTAIAWNKFFNIPEKMITYASTKRK